MEKDPNSAPPASEDGNRGGAQSRHEVHLILKPQEIVDGKGAHGGDKKGASHFLASHFGALLTLVGVVLAAYIGIYAGVFQKNEPPSAEIKAIIGDTLVTSAETGSTAEGDSADSGGAVATGFAFVRTGHAMTFFADRTYDPDGDLRQLEFRWSLEQSGKGARALCDAPPDTEKTLPQRTCDLTLDDPGIFLVRLDVTDNQNCGWVRATLFGSAGCRKSATATVLLKSIEYSRPELVLQKHRTKYRSGETVTIDASRSRGFDGRLLEHVLWHLNGVEHSLSPTLQYPLSSADAGLVNVSVIAIDRFGGRSDPVKIAIEVTAPDRIARAVLSTGSSPAGNPETPSNPIHIPSADEDTFGICRGHTDPIVVDRDVKLEIPNRRCDLSSKVFTQGNALEISAKIIDAQGGASITSFPSGTSGLAGNDGAPGAKGAEGAGHGANGGPGQRGSIGAPGRKGSDARPLAISGKRLVGQLRLSNAGQLGGDGGNGGSGGTGGNGARGDPARPGILDCRSGPGRGGDGGKGGAGGNGGDAGRGGNAAAILVKFDTIDKDSHISLSAEGGSSGKPGVGGKAGRGGHGGPEGRLAGLCRSAGRVGRPGPPGARGQFGVSAPSGSANSVTVIVNSQKVQRVGSLKYGGR